MDSGSSVEGQTSLTSNKTRRAPAPLQAQTISKRPSAGILVLLMTTVLVIGVLIGGLLERQRVHARQIVASINGTSLDSNELDHQLQSAFGAAVVSQWAKQVLMIEYAKKLGVAPTDAQVASTYKERLADPQFQKNMVQQGINPEETKLAINADLAQQNILTRNIVIPEAKLQEYYKKNIDPSNPKAQFRNPETVQFATVITNTQQAANQAQDELAKGVPFQTVAQEFSVDASKANGGVMTPIRRGGKVMQEAPGLENLIFSLKPGQTSSPEYFVGKWWVIKMLTHINTSVLPFDKVKDQCRVGCAVESMTPQQKSKYQQDLDAFKKQASIQIFWPQFNSVLRTL